MLPLSSHAPHGGLDLYGQHYKGGEFIPFYVPRILMPQVEGKYYDDFRKFAGDRISEHSGIDPASVVPHQRVQVDHAINLSDDLARKPIIISEDNFILDGHHRWYWHVKKPELLNVLKVDLPFNPAIDFLFQYPNTYCYRDSQGDER